MDHLHWQSFKRNRQRQRHERVLALTTLGDMTRNRNNPICVASPKVAMQVNSDCRSCLHYRVTFANVNTALLRYIRGLCKKTFYGRKLLNFIISQSVCSWKASPAQSIVSGQGQDPTVECRKPKGVSLGQAPTLPTSTIQSWKGLQGANTLTYYANS